MPFFAGDEEVTPGEDWLASGWDELADWLIDEVITDFLADIDAGDYF